jgi:hypothetical protein
MYKPFAGSSLMTTVFVQEQMLTMKEVLCTEFLSGLIMKTIQMKPTGTMILLF